MKYHTIELNEKELFRLKLMDAYEKMDPKNVRYLCKLFGIHHSTFYRLKKQYNPYKLVSIKYRSRKPKRLKTMNGLGKAEFLPVHLKRYTTGGREGI